MSMIKINCPSCKSPLQIAEQKLRETQGRVVCHECRHIFRLVKKNKKINTPKQEVINDKALFSDVGVQNNEIDPVWPNDGWPTEENDPLRSENKSNIKNNTASTKKKTTSKTQKQRLTYRIPKADDRPAFADVEQKKPFAFNLLDAQAANMQVPQVSVNPSENALQTAQQALQRTTSDQQNNITIHTGSLVFTLVGDSQGSNTTLTASDGSKFAEPSVQGIQPNMAPVIQPSSELSWTTATIAALIVLIIQLFYWI